MGSSEFELFNDRLRELGERLRCLEAAVVEISGRSRKKGDEPQHSEILKRLDSLYNLGESIRSSIVGKFPVSGGSVFQRLLDHGNELYGIRSLLKENKDKEVKVEEVKR